MLDWQRIRMKFLSWSHCWLTLFLLALGVSGARAQMPVLGAVGSHDPSTMIKNGVSYFVYSDGQGY